MLLWAKQALDAWREGPWLSPAGYVFRPLHKAGVLIGQQLNPQTVHDLVTEYAEATGLAPLAPHDLRRTYAKLSRNGGAELDRLRRRLGTPVCRPRKGTWGKRNASPMPRQIGQGCD
jgi:integrase/recombinase XerD